METLQIELLKVDMSSEETSACSACDTIQQKLNKAVEMVRPLLTSLKTQVEQKITTVYTEEEARANKVMASPTIRVGNFDFYPEHDGLNEKRIWEWNGKILPNPSKEVLAECILRGYLGEINQKAQTDISPYVKQFLSKQPETHTAEGCC